MGHLYYRLKIKLDSPMSIGSGKETETDGDIILNSNNEPYIPGTSLAGIYRSLFDKEKQETFFGYIDGEKHLQSPIIVYDGQCLNYNRGDISNRDSVKLDEYKVAETGAKFDFQIAETGLEFVSYIELDKNHTKEMENAIENIILPALNSGKISLGHKTTRGYGKVSVIYQKKEFDLDTDCGLNCWLDFDMFDDNNWSTDEKDELIPKKYTTDFEIIKIPLVQKGAVSIRRYVTNAGENQPDYEQLTLKDERPVIPGTSWAGAFRHRIAGYGVENQKINDLFGYISTNRAIKESKKSKIYFSETILLDGESKQITRNSIDRFSAGTKEGALFTERTYYNGKTELEIRLNTNDIDILMIKLVYACVLDLCLGYLAVGGLTAVGHGMFELDKNRNITINDKEVDIREKLKGGECTNA